jgi:hypothetical protein
MCQSVSQPPATATLSGAAISRQEGILLWSMRAWVIGITQKIPVEEQIQDAFNRIGAPDATGQLSGFMWILSQGANRMLNVDCVCQNSISRDERILLDILALSQHKRTFEAMVMLRSLVRRSSAVAAAESAVKVMSSLSAAKFTLPVRSMETTRHAFPTQEFRHRLFGEPDSVVTYH